MMHLTLKLVRWLGSSKDDLRRFPKDARHAAGEELRRVQRGLAPIDWKPMKAIGPGVAEIRVRTRVEHRVIYVARFEEAIYVLHAFEKRSRKTSRSDINMARCRLAGLVAQRQRAKRNT
jgi:phage-related protein